MKVLPFVKKQVLDDMGGSEQAIYIVKYLGTLDAKTVLIEYDYVNKDYLIDYANYYCRSFSKHERYVTRLHFFSENFFPDEIKNEGNPRKNEQQLREYFLNIFHKEEFKKNLDSYLGYTVIKPIFDEDSNNFIGKTLLKPLNENKNGYEYLTHDYEASLFGIPLKIKSLPYQAQDKIVSMCATTALWISTQALNSVFETHVDLSPYEITETSLSVPSENRNFPTSGGLSTYQMKTYFNKIGFETELINVDEGHGVIGGVYELLQTTVKAYLRYGIPVIACLCLERATLGNPEYHAVVITGYKCDSEGNIIELYVHDDQVGPYSTSSPTHKRISESGPYNLVNWENDWTKNKGFSQVRVIRLMVPLYPKIRYPFSKIYEEYMETKTEFKTKGYNTDLFITDVNTYKKQLVEFNISEKGNVLVTKLPRFLWVIRVTKEGDLIPSFDSVFDATSSIRPTEDKPKVIDYMH